MSPDQSVRGGWFYKLLVSVYLVSPVIMANQETYGDGAAQRWKWLHSVPPPQPMLHPTAHERLLPEIRKPAELQLQAKMKACETNASREDIARNMQELAKSEDQDMFDLDFDLDCPTPSTPEPVVSDIEEEDDEEDWKLDVAAAVEPVEENSYARRYPETSEGLLDLRPRVLPKLIVYDVDANIIRINRDLEEEYKNELLTLGGPDPFSEAAPKRKHVSLEISAETPTSTGSLRRFSVVAAPVQPPSSLSWLEIPCDILDTPPPQEAPVKSLTARDCFLELEEIEQQLDDLYTNETIREAIHGVELDDVNQIFGY